MDSAVTSFRWATRLGYAHRKRPGSLCDAVSGVVPLERIAAHFHNTYEQALANLLAAIEHGVQTLDAAAGGLGGCYAKGASGNVATEAVNYIMDGMVAEPHRHGEAA